MVKKWLETVQRMVGVDVDRHQSVEPRFSQLLTLSTSTMLVLPFSSFTEGEA